MSGAPPDKAEREACWLARDIYWACLDANQGNVKKCASLRRDYENNCSKQWVKHFDRRYKYEKYKEKFEKEAFQRTEETDENRR